jgi:hypothetical protein
MNLQPITADTLLAAKSRMTELQETIRATELTISEKRTAHFRQLRSALENTMQPAEFAALFPAAPVDSDFVVENEQIAQKQAEVQSLKDDPSGGAGWYYRFYKIQRLEQEIAALQASKTIALDNYLTNQAQPQRALVREEFDQLYAAPTFETETAAIVTAAVEVGQLHAFLQSGPYPQPGNYDVDHLIGTALEMA